MKFIAVLCLAFVFACSACGPNQRIINSAAEDPLTRSNSTEANATPPVEVTVEQDIEAMRTADFNFIYVFRRKDGAPFDADDKAYASHTIPAQMNRRRLSDGGRALIIGSNFRMPPEILASLRDRFAFEDHSKSRDS